MKLIRIIFFGIILLPCAATAQSTQTIRGRIVDEVTGTPLVGVNVMIISMEDKLVGSATDVDGYFRIENVPVGRHTLEITFIGYEKQTLPNTVVTAGKEVVFNVALIESVSELSEIVVVADSKEDKTATNNDLAIVSSRSFNVDDTKRYAGALGDPSRMAANFAGVVGGDDSRNDIVVRGNSPLGMLWQMEGLNIPNPNHFGALVSTGGPVSMLNNNNLDKSDFMSSAFPAQYGNALSGVFDLRLRDGNNEKSELLAQAGFNGFEFGAEGPFSKNSASSFVVNYRYSTLAIFQTLGLEFGTGTNTPYYQDINFKLTFPNSKNGKWSVFGFGGTSKIDLLGSEADLDSDTDLYGDENQDAYPRYKTGMIGVGYEGNFSEKTFFKITSGLSYANEEFTSDSLVRNSESEVIASYLQTEATFTTRKAMLNFYTRTKFNSRNSITSGIVVDFSDIDLYARNIYANLNRDTVNVDAVDQMTLYQFHTNWRHRFNTSLLLNVGAHAQYYTLNNQWVLEPRMSLQYIINPQQSLALGYGVHSQIQNPYVNYVQTKTSNGEMIETNLDLGFTKSHHYALTYDWNMSSSVRLKAEAYYQHLTDVPVERNSSSYAAINTGASFAPPNVDSLVNQGTGRNYGIELTLERFFNKGYYYLVTGSLFDSNYEGSDGIERNTAFNTQYVLNVLGGKEWKLNSGSKFFSVNLKLTTIGGKYLTPIDYELSQLYGRTVYKESEAYSEKQDPYFRADLKLSYRIEYRKSTLEIALDLQNVTNNKNIFSQSYNSRTNTIVTQYQQSFFPVPFVRYTF